MLSQISYLQKDIYGMFLLLEYTQNTQIPKKKKVEEKLPGTKRERNGKLTV